MANRYLDLDGAEQIRNSYQLIPEAFDGVEADIDAAAAVSTGIQNQVTSQNGRLTTAESTITSYGDRITETETAVESVQTQVNTLVVSGDSSPAAAQAAVDAEGHDYGNLKVRLDTEHTSLSAQLAETPKKEEVDTSSGWDWQRTYKPTYLVDDGEAYLAAGRPGSTRRKLIFVGSSVCYGWLASDNLGWANRLKAVLIGSGWTVKNHSVPGDTTQGVINRFYTDIAPERPDIVVVALSLGNENIQGAASGTPKEIIYNRYRDNLVKLVRMIRQQGAIPVIASTYPRNEFSAEDYAYSLQINNEIDTWDVYQLNLMGNVDDGNGHFLPGTFGDSVHPNDVGHEAMFKGIPASVFDNLHRYTVSIPRLSGYINTGLDRATTNPLAVFLGDPIESFTVFFKLRTHDGLNTKVFFGVGTDDARIRNTTSFLEYTSGSGMSIMSTLDIKADRNSHDIALSYNKITDKVKLYIDGIFVGDTIDAIDTSVFRLAGGANYTYNADDCDFKDFLLYRVVLNDKQVAGLTSGFYPRSGLDIYAPLSDKDVTTGRRLVNLVPTNSYLMAISPTLSARANVTSI